MPGERDPLIWTSATELSRRIAARDLSPVELMAATLDRIEAVNPTFNAIVSLRDRDALMAEAVAAEAAAPRGWLHGIPVAIKDLVATDGIRCTFGSPIFADFVPQADDGLARRMKAAGAIVIGKTNVPEFGLGSHTRNPVHGATGNAYDATRSAGGSSGGAAVALATGMLSVADGSDMMGSLRNPAAWNNVYGFRPTAGLVPDDAADRALLHRLSTDGPMARNPDDLEALLLTLSGGVHAPARASDRPVIGWLGDWGGSLPMEPGLLALCENALADMEVSGWQVEQVPPPILAEVLWQSWTELRSFLTAVKLGPHWRDPEDRARLNAQAIWEIERGLAFTGADIDRALAQRLDWLAAARGLFDRFDALAMPTTQMWPFPVDTLWPTEIAGRTLDTYHRWMEVVIPSSLGGFPALAVPAGFGAEGLPGGLQLMGRHGSDGMLLSLGRQWHMATDWPAKRRPAA